MAQGWNNRAQHQTGRHGAEMAWAWHNMGLARHIAQDWHGMAAYGGDRAWYFWVWHSLPGSVLHSLAWHGTI